MDIETKLAGVSMTRVELRDIERRYNKFSQEGLAKLSPAIDWAAYFKAMGSPPHGKYIVCQPDFIAAVSRLFTELPLDVHRAYLKWHIINDLSYCLDEAHEKPVLISTDVHSLALPR